MSAAITTNEETIKNLIENLRETEEMRASSEGAYNVLRGACEGILEARILAANSGERIQLSTVCELIEAALTQAEIVQSIGPDDTDLAHPHPYCTVCNTLWIDEDEMAGRCLTCEGSGLTS